MLPSWFPKPGRPSVKSIWPNASVRVYEVIDEAKRHVESKRQLEAVFPGVCSCADMYPATIHKRHSSLSSKFTNGSMFSQRFSYNVKNVFFLKKHQIDQMPKGRLISF